ncbi:hypothetical protein DICVIV_08066 [Dictyocaulus viviparus]|uniref:Alpha-ketoglutarate-dependent dioxygenase AlkB-like domain-containing protein n=1 Tax=Dictyocaulus viviparus TaxID=29172 RepID=A0A0D8XQ50_DICVI|nr:hypothetical protein DICVIV_08066 [Dictyocaulus viviparus]
MRYYGMTSTKVSTQTCGCKGVRFCALCETSERVQKLKIADDKYADYDVYVFSRISGSCIRCPALTSSATVGDIIEASKSCDSAKCYQNAIFIGGIMVVPNFLSESEEHDLLVMIDGVDWMLSQSGRRKQDYGPKVNFKRRKVKTDHFSGMPEYADWLLERMQLISEEKLGNYIPFEMCNLEYDQSKKSCIEMHCDDVWIWGNRLIRYRWQHGILSHHIQGRRIALTMREPSKEFQEGGDLYEKYGKQLIALSNNRVPLRKCV